MATKTISIDLEAYHKLVQGRSAPSESFSSVIKRAEIKPLRGLAGHFLHTIKGAPRSPDSAFEAWDNLTDSPPEDPWRD